ncbi:hypothetical protein SISNIDRAFT_325654 [Sistotremastrum niveocremeum HHB9708]|uniref:Uncharacterized protein n=1 Tax=Sistotremastrum niveocremeum HHB9708 TaxID=1314777 RepID=A0A164X9Q0_9AGAM|nr:hypothetical protein SISNIDRAFT_325654 [Sistotremastrum niveocremeum HHB9708]
MSSLSGSYLNLTQRLMPNMPNFWRPGCLLVLFGRLRLFHVSGFGCNKTVRGLRNPASANAGTCHPIISRCVIKAKALVFVGSPLIGVIYVCVCGNTVTVSPPIVQVHETKAGTARRMLPVQFIPDGWMVLTGPLM